MTGQDVPYHLRVNKYVERQLFVETLEAVDKWRPLKGGYYVAMGGRQMEDFRLIHNRLGVERMRSLEQDSSMKVRQEFNRPLGFVECTDTSTSDFLVGLDGFVDSVGGSPLIVWFDFASAKDRQAQLREAQSLVTGLRDGDVIKITMNGEPKSFGEQRDGESGVAMRRRRAENLENRLGGFTVAGSIDSSKVNHVGVAGAIGCAIWRALQGGCRSSAGPKARLLSSYRYTDGMHQMVTVTAILISPEMVEEFEGEMQKRHIRLPERGGYDRPELIDVPDLSIKERLTIDSFLFDKEIDELVDELPFFPNSEKEKAKGMLERYVTHYRRYPSFIPLGS